MAGRGMWRHLCLLLHILPDRSPRVGDVMPNKVQAPGSYTSTHNQEETAFLSKVIRQDSGPSGLLWLAHTGLQSYPLTNRVTGKSKILRKDGLFPSDHRAEAMGRDGQKCLTHQEEFPADKLTVPQDSQLSGRAKQTRLYIRNTDAHRLKKLVNAKWIINSVSEQKK